MALAWPWPRGASRPNFEALASALASDPQALALALALALKVQALALALRFWP